MPTTTSLMVASFLLCVLCCMGTCFLATNSRCNPPSPSPSSTHLHMCSSACSLAPSHPPPFSPPPITHNMVALLPCPRPLQHPHVPLVWVRAAWRAASLTRCLPLPHHHHTLWDLHVLHIHCMYCMKRLHVAFHCTGLPSPHTPSPSYTHPGTPALTNILPPPSPPPPQKTHRSPRCG